MSRMEQIDDGAVIEAKAELSADPEMDEFLANWNKMGRAAMFFCIWSAMAIPVLLIISVR